MKNDQFTKKLKEANNLIEIQSKNVTDEYMKGLYNGMELILSIFESREPIYWSKKRQKMIKKSKTTKRFCPVCGKEFHPRVVDIKRGWGKFCSKRCKAIYQSKNDCGVFYLNIVPYDDGTF